LQRDGLQAKEYFMTQSNSQDIFIQSVQAEVFDPITGHIDGAATAELQKQVFTDANIVRVNGVVDHAKTLAKRILAKQAFHASRS
jgi:hypothetical protein